MTRLFVGVDLGRSGAVATWRPPALPTVQSLPVHDDGTLDVDGFVAVLAAAITDDTRGEPRPLLVTEAVFRPNSLVRLLGGVEAVAAVCDFDVTVTPVVTWKKKLLGSNSSDKQRSIDLCKRLFPDVCLRRTPRARGDSHDFAEAVLLAYYGRLISQPTGAVQ